MRVLNKIKYILAHEGYVSLIVRPYKLIVKLLNNIIIKLFCIFPIKDNKIILESQGDYTDNVRVFSDYLLSIGQKDYKVIWLVQNPKYYRTRYKGIFTSRNEYHVNLVADYHIATTKYFIFSHPYWLKKWRDNQVVINTTHSVAQLKSSSDNGQKNLYNYVLTCSEYCTEIRKKTFFDNDNSHFLCLGQPRLDLMFLHKDCKSVLLSEQRDAKLILCMETFKQTTSWDDGGAGDSYAINVIKSLEELKKLDLFLKENRYLMIVKIHHLQDLGMIKKIELSNIRYMYDSDLAKHDIQVNELLENADILLTDYSSVFYDYLLTDKPIGFLIGDISEYKRGFMMDYPLEEMPGRKIQTLNELTDFISMIRLGKDDYYEARKIIRDKVFMYQDGNNSRRLMDWLKSHSMPGGKQ